MAKFERIIYIAGKTLMIKEKAKRIRVKGEKRMPKSSITAEKVWEYNLRQAIFNLAVLLNANFRPGDWSLQLTFAESMAIDEVKAARDKCMRKLRDLCKKEGIAFKWILVPHVAGDRYHFHLICNQEVPYALIKKAWVYGVAFEKAHLWDNPNYYQLAFYLMHEARELRDLKAGGEEEIPFTKRYSCSRNLIKPEPYKEDLTRCDIEAEPKARKGYILDGEVQRYENLVNGMPCREYIQVSIEEEPRIKRWKKGTMATGERMTFAKLLREAYREFQENMFDSLDC